MTDTINSSVFSMAGAKNLAFLLSAKYSNQPEESTKFIFFRPLKQYWYPSL
jgi:hypothetical protein